MGWVCRLRRHTGQVEEADRMRERSAVETRVPRQRCSPRGRGLGATPRRVAVDLSPQAVEQVAGRVVELIGEREPATKLISAGELAHLLGVERPWIYRNRHLLGGMRIGEGPKAPWRFD